MDDGLSDLTDLSDLNGGVTFDRVLHLQEIPSREHSARIRPILVTLSRNLPPAR